MRVLRLRMLNSLEPMGILLRKSDSILFRTLGNSLWEGDNLQESWYKLQQKEIKRGKMLDSLTNQDLELLNQFFENLGKSSRNEQCLLFSSIISQMEEAQAQAKRAYSESSRVYTALGALAGIGICILVV